MSIFDRIEYEIDTIDEMEIGEYIFFDIETATKVDNFDDLHEIEQKAWLKSARRAYKNLCFDENGDEYPDSGQRSYYEKGGLFPEYNVVVTISLGRIIEGELVIKALTLNDGTEEEIIAEFAKGIKTNKAFKLVGYNIIGFDIPVLLKKMIKYKIDIPHQLRIDAKKPWEMDDVAKDIFYFWKAGRWDYFPSFNLVCNYLGIDSSKSFMDGSQVNDYYHKPVDGLEQEERINLIAKYCNEDVRATYDLFMYLRNQKIY